MNLDGKNACCRTYLCERTVEPLADDVDRPRRTRVGGDGRENQGVDNYGSGAAHEASGHPDRALGEAALVDGKPVMKGASNIRVSASFSHAEAESDGHHRPEA